jgi:hypothetical protein
VDAGGRTLAERGLALAQALADLAAGGTSPTVPDLGPFAVPDQIVVTATDLCDAADVDSAALQAVVDRLAELDGLVPRGV